MIAAVALLHVGRMGYNAVDLCVRMTDGSLKNGTYATRPIYPYILLGPNGASLFIGMRCYFAVAVALRSRQ